MPNTWPAGSETSFLSLPSLTHLTYVERTMKTIVLQDLLPFSRTLKTLHMSNVDPVFLMEHNSYRFLSLEALGFQSSNLMPEFFQWLYDDLRKEQDHRVFPWLNGLEIWTPTQVISRGLEIFLKTQMELRCSLNTAVDILPIKILVGSDSQLRKYFRSLNKEYGEVVEIQYYDAGEEEPYCWE